MNVIKRDGTIVEFNKEKINSAIKKALVDTQEYKKDIITESKKLTEKVCESLNELYDEYIEIEQIQDEVENCLMNENYKDTAKSYILYRHERTKKRNEHPLDESILGLLDMTNEEVIKENSNKQSQLVSTQRDLIAGEVSKYISRKKLIPKEIIEAHDRGVIHLHDLDYFLQPLSNCELVPLNTMFKEGTVINKKLIETPKSLRTASTLATQIAAQISSMTYGGQTMSLSHFAPYVRISKEKIKKQIIEEGLLINKTYNEEEINLITEKRLKQEIKDSVQTFNYQLSTLNSTNGQSPFLSLAMYISEDPEYEEETAMLIEEFLNQRIEGMKNEFGVKSTATFPKLLFFLEENNMYPDSKYYYLKELAVKSTAKRMNPDFISTKRMRELYGAAYPCMGCRAFLSPYYDENNKLITYGRGNVGVVTVNLPYVALLAEKDENKFWNELDKILKLCFDASMLRFDKFKGVKASVAPLLWQHGVFSRLNPDDEILPIMKKTFTVSLGYSGLYETALLLSGESHTKNKGKKMATKIMQYLNDTISKWKEETGLMFALYGTPQESTGGVFSNKIEKEFGKIKDVTDKGFITNSYHVDVREEINAFDKLELEGKFQSMSLGGCVSYVETYNMEKNLEALEQVVDFIYDNCIYAEFNFESDTCGKCLYSGVMQYDLDNDLWVCPQCGNNDQSKLSVVRRTCGYLGENVWSKGRILDILNRVKHL